MARTPREREQHIAVFGESGSGKTVMVSSFYGASQEPDFLRSSLFTVTADDVGQGNRLHQNYLGMKRQSRRPETTRFSATPFTFTVRLRDRSARTSAFDALRLVWHDYPGDWFEEEVTDPELAKRRLATFRALLGSDVALLLVDGQRLLDNAGEEERYLKALFSSYRTGLLRLRDDLLENGRPLIRFPRIWVLALSKADLLPDLDVFGFRDMVIEKATDDLAELRKVIQKLVDSPGALSVGEDFMLISSAKFEPNKIEVSERVGIDLILPMASMLPLERHMTWIERKKIGPALVEQLLDGATWFTALLGKTRFKHPIARIASYVGSRAAVVAADLGRKQLSEWNAEASARKDYMAVVLSRFGLDLDDAEDQKVLLRSTK